MMAMWWCETVNKTYDSNCLSVLLIWTKCSCGALRIHIEWVCMCVDCCWLRDIVLCTQYIFAFVWVFLLSSISFFVAFFRFPMNRTLNEVADSISLHNNHYTSTTSSIRCQRNNESKWKKNTFDWKMCGVKGEKKEVNRSDDEKRDVNNKHVHGLCTWIPDCVFITIDFVACTKFARLTAFIRWKRSYRLFWSLLSQRHVQIAYTHKHMKYARAIRQ